MRRGIVFDGPVKQRDCYNSFCFINDELVGIKAARGKDGDTDFGIWRCFGGCGVMLVAAQVPGGGVGPVAVRVRGGGVVPVPVAVQVRGGGLD